MRGHSPHQQEYRVPRVTSPRSQPPPWPVRVTLLPTGMQKASSLRASIPHSAYCWSLVQACLMALSVYRSDSRT